MALNPGEEVISGVVLVSVAADVSAGTELGPSATEGQLASGSGGYSALTDEGGAAGLSTKETIPAGYAGVRVSGHMPVTYEAGEAVSAGDVVGLNGGTLALADDTTDTNAVGVVGYGGGADAGDEYASGEDAPVHIID